MALSFCRILLLAFTVICCFMLFNCIIYAAEMYAAVRTFDRQVLINLS